MDRQHDDLVDFQSYGKKYLRSLIDMLERVYAPDDSIMEELQQVIQTLNEIADRDSAIFIGDPLRKNG